jgi:hypothetical protein
MHLAAPHRRSYALLDGGVDDGLWSSTRRAWHGRCFLTATIRPALIGHRMPLHLTCGREPTYAACAASVRPAACVDYLGTVYLPRRPTTVKKCDAHLGHSSAVAVAVAAAATKARTGQEKTAQDLRAPSGRAASDARYVANDAALASASRHGLLPFDTSAPHWHTCPAHPVMSGPICAWPLTFFAHIRATIVPIDNLSTSHLRRPQICSQRHHRHHDSHTHRTRRLPFPCSHPRSACIVFRLNPPCHVALKSLSLHLQGLASLPTIPAKQWIQRVEWPEE